MTHAVGGALGGPPFRLIVENRVVVKAKEIAEVMNNFFCEQD